MRGLLALWRARWGVVRLAAAAALVWILAMDTPARLARLQLAALPDADFATEVRDLRERGCYAEALVVADAGLAAGPGAPGGPERERLLAERRAAEEEQRSLVRRLRDLARGAITGGGDASTGTDQPDPSLELLLGAVATDLLVVGDVRDLVIQSGRWARGEKTDPVIVMLSGVGLATTLAPEIDWAPSVLKAARRRGVMSDRFGELLISAVRRGDTATFRAVMRDIAAISRHASPAGAMRLMRSIDSAEDAARLARFLERTGAPGARALRVTGDTGVALARSAESLRGIGRIDDAVAVERTLLDASRKGRTGAAWLARGWHRPLLRPHPLVGIVKSVWKGNAQALIARSLRSLDPFADWTLPLAAAWLFFEAALLARRVLPRHRNQPAVDARSSPVAR